VAVGKVHYHADCYHVKETLEEIRDLFCQKINPLQAGRQQIGILVATINRIVFDRNVDPDFLKFVLEYYISNKPGVLHFPPGLYYAIQDKGANDAWSKLQEQKRQEQVKEMKNKISQDAPAVDDGFLDGLGGRSFVYKSVKQRGFDDILR